MPVLGGCGCLLILAALACAGFSWFGFTIFQKSEQIAVRVDAPPRIEAGQDVEIRVVVTNGKESENLRITSLDVAEDLLGGFTEAGVDPPPTGSTRILGTLSHDYQLEVPPGAEQVFVLRWRATQPGTYAGDIDVHGPMSVNTFYTRLVVEPPGGTPAAP
jgi:uncharacterized protein (DUF58 family)